MPKVAYIPKVFNRVHARLISQANSILGEYIPKGYVLTLRQLYYQFVARDILPNNDRSYKRLGSVVNDARLAGEIDWNHIIDRTRFVRQQTYWSNPPPNPAKLSDARALRYIDRFGDESWELDALEPRVIEELVSDAVMGVRDHDAWAQIEAEEERQGEVLRACHERWAEVAEFLS